MTDSEFREAFYSHKDVLYRFAYRMTGSHDVAGYVRGAMERRRWLRFRARGVALLPAWHNAEFGIEWWRFLLTGSIRVPVPVALGLAMLMTFGAWRAARTDTMAPCISESKPPASVACPAGMRC